MHVQILLYCSCFIMFLITPLYSFQQQDCQIPVPQRSAANLYFNGSLGSIFKSQTPNPGNVHLSASFRITNADYTRSVFDGIPEALNSLGFSTTITSVFQLYRSQNNISQISLTIGTQQGLTTRNVPGSFGNRAWYESNYYGGILFVTPKELSFSITYLMATSPDIATFGQELDIAIAGYSKGIFDRWRPSVEISVPFSGSNGFLTQILVNPSISYYKESSWPLSIAFPFRAGAGLFGYHVPKDNFTGYISAGFILQLGLKSISTAFGNWDLSLGLDLVYRDSKIAAISPQDKSGNLILIGGLGISLMY